MAGCKPQRSCKCWSRRLASSYRSIGKEDTHEQNGLCRTLRNALRRPRAHGEVLPGRVWLADADAWGGEGNYVIATTTETDESGPKRPGAINGGFFARKPEWPAQHPSL